ncbi:MAG TPA: phosphoribosylformylglycinamidine synthase I [Candidatus Eisenbacteria bacterium]|nr:phosphoribosylformylglycinamidine synthase I [Candidatus Eisenbacteria bacterium]
MSRVIVLRSPGTNCDEETAHAFGLAGCDAERIHVGEVIRRERRLDEFDVLALPGGFAFGDDLGAGTVLANRLRSRLADDLRAFVDSGRLVIGICNGFQVLVRLGLLPGWEGEKAVSLVHNASGKFEDRWVGLRIESPDCPFLDAEPERRAIRLPVAHGEGRFVARDPEVLERLEAGGQVAIRYASLRDPGRTAEGYPDNPNGSVNAIAGITNPAGNVLGLMPHPERHIHPWNDPGWTRRRAAGETSDPAEPRGDGFLFFAGAARHARAAGR